MVDNELFKNVGKTTKEKAPKVPEPESQTQDDPIFNYQPTELELLKQRANLMGIAFSDDIDINGLKAKIEEHKENATAKEKASVVDDGSVNNQVEQASQVQTNNNMNLREYLQREKMRLVRLRITNLDPKKKDLPGEILTVANEYIGTVRKFVPFGEQTDNGYHVPYCLYELMRDRQFLSIKTRKGPKGQTIVEQQMAREFALEILPPLTEAELARLSAAQQAAGGIE